MKMTKILSFVALALLMAACQLAPGIEQGGELTIRVGNDINARTLTPSIDMNAAAFVVSGSGPNGGSFVETTTGAPVTQGKLAFGSWTISVRALNATGATIGTGSAVVQVHTGQTSSVTVSVVPITGTGSLNIQVGWVATDIDSASIVASLSPAQGAAQPLGFVLGSGSASYAGSGLANGYYSLALSLQDNGISVMGAVEVVRIVTGQTTSGSYAFTNVHKPGGSVLVNIIANMENPLDLSIAGSSPTLNPGSSQTLSATVANFSGNVVLVWYLNGVSSGSGSSFTFGPGLDPGYYRVDVIAFSVDGTRAGSATTSIQVNAVNNDPPALLKVIRGAASYSFDPLGNLVRTVIWSEPNMAPPYQSLSAYAKDFTSVGGLKLSQYIGGVDNGFGIEFLAALGESELTAGYLVADGTNWASLSDWSAVNPQFIPASVTTGLGSVVLAYGYYGYGAVKIVHGGQTIWLIFNANS